MRVVLWGVAGVQKIEATRAEQKGKRRSLALGLIVGPGLMLGPVRLHGTEASAYVLRDGCKIRKIAAFRKGTRWISLTRQGLQNGLSTASSTIRIIRTVGTSLIIL